MGQAEAFTFTKTGRKVSGALGGKVVQISIVANNMYIFSYTRVLFFLKLNQKNRELNVQEIESVELIKKVSKWVWFMILVGILGMVFTSGISVGLVFFAIAGVYHRTLEIKLKDGKIFRLKDIATDHYVPKFVEALQRVNPQINYITKNTAKEAQKENDI